LIRVLLWIAGLPCRLRPALALWRCPNEVESVERERERVGLNERETWPARVFRHRFDVDPSDVEACKPKAVRIAATAAE
jgi:hypothetical protein